MKEITENQFIDGSLIYLLAVVLISAINFCDVFYCLEWHSDSYYIHLYLYFINEMLNNICY